MSYVELIGEEKLLQLLTNKTQCFPSPGHNKMSEGGRSTQVFTIYDDLESGNILTKYEASPIGGKIKVENVKIWIKSHDFMTNVGGDTIQ